MPYFAEGPVTNDIMTIRQVIYASVQSDITDVPSGNQLFDVTDLLGTDDPNSIVGRQLDISTPATPTLEDRVDTTVIDQKNRLHLAAQQGFILNRAHWPGLSSNGSNSHNAVIRWIFHTTASADLVVDSNWRNSSNQIVSHTPQQREAIVVGIEQTLLGTNPTVRGSVRQWYDLMEMSTSSQIRDQWRGVSIISGAILYGDAIESAGTLRTPDGAFAALSNNTIPANFDIDSPTLRNP